MMNSIVTIILLICVLTTFNEINGQINNGRIQYSVRNKYQSKEEDTSHIITFPDSIEENDNESDYRIKNNKNKGENDVIPLEILEQINDIQNVSQFFNEIIEIDSVNPREVAISRFGSDENVERSIGIIAQPAGCTPENTVVPLEPLNPSKDPTVIYFPSCTRVKRCSGCCSSPLLSCQPTKTETLTFLIYKSQFTGGNKMAYRGKEIVLVDQHQECKCDCKIKKSDCNAYQFYEPTQCKCICNNFDEQNKCFSQQDKIWDASNCTCRCRGSGNCTSGSYFDEHQCRCLQIPSVYKSEISPPPTFYDRKKFILKAIPVDPTNDTKYDATK